MGFSFYSFNNCVAHRPSSIVLLTEEAAFNFFLTLLPSKNRQGFVLNKLCEDLGKYGMKIATSYSGRSTVHAMCKVGRNSLGLEDSLAWQSYSCGMDSKMFRSPTRKKKVATLTNS